MLDDNPHVTGLVHSTTQNLLCRKHTASSQEISCCAWAMQLQIDAVGGRTRTCIDVLVKVRLWGAMSSLATPPLLLTRAALLALVRRPPSPAAEILGSRLLAGAAAP